MATTEGQAMGSMEEIAADLKKYEARMASSAPDPSTEYQMNQVDATRLANDFVFHPVKGDQARRYQEIREAQRNLAALILTRCPPSRERSVAMTKLEEVGFWANASIARNE